MEKVIDITTRINQIYAEVEKREDRKVAWLLAAFIVLGIVGGVGIVLMLPGWMGY